MTDIETLARVVEFHGHMCPGLAMGVRAAEVGLERIGAHAADEEVVAVVETDMCGVDAIQFMTGCTFGKGNLVHRDHGKNAYTFVRRSDNRAVRVSVRPAAARRAPGWQELFAKIRSRTASPEERERFFAMQQEGSERILSMPLDELYDVRELQVEPPPPARILATVECTTCGEPTMETRVRRLEGAELCPPCFDQSMAGSKPVAAPAPASRRPAT